MTYKPNVIERAYQLSADGVHRDIQQIRDTLRLEGYSNIQQHFSGRTIKRQILARIKAVSKAS